MNGDIDYKRKNEKQVVEKMIKFYCRKNHDASDGLCKECGELRNYAFSRSDQCPFMKSKTFCANCKIHCYKPEMREKIRKVMRYSGKRFLFIEPGLALQHASKSLHSIVQLIIAILGVFIALCGIITFNRYLLMDFPLEIRMVLMIVTQWSLMTVPLILMFLNKEQLKDLGVTTKNMFHQVLIGLILAVIMSFFLTIVPILAGYKEMVGSTSYTQPWQFLYEFFYSLIGVALAEEFVFRGYIFHKLLEIKDSKWFAIIGSSALFGLFHVFNGNLIQVLMTGLIGILFCMFREKIRSCTLVSLVVAHGLYDGMITLWVALS